MKVKIGTRGSALALWQANYVADRLRAEHSGLEAELVLFKTKGDRFLDQPLADLGGKGLFTRELEDSLRQGTIDLAVHSLKDLPTALPDGLMLGAIPQRADPRDGLVFRVGETETIPAIVGTASLRRTCLARRRWAKGRIEAIRGNVPTRVGRLNEAPPRRIDVAILAMAGLERLELLQRADIEVRPLPADEWIPAVSQGALGIEQRSGDERTAALLAPLNHRDTAVCVFAERVFLSHVEGDCRVPVGAHATLDSAGGKRLTLRGFVGHPDDGGLVVAEAKGDDPQSIGERVGQQVLDDGGREILEKLRG